MPTYQAIFYQKDDGSEPAKEFILSVDKKMRAKILKTIAMLQNNGTELRMPYSEYLEDSDLVFGFESDRLLTTAFIASVPNHPLIEEFEKSYWNLHFILEDGSCDLTCINDRLSELAVHWGLDLDLDAYQELKDNIKVYPRDYFAAFDVYNWHTKVTENTCAIHYMNSSWAEPKTKLRFMVIKAIHAIIGEQNYDRIRAVIKKRKIFK